MTDKAWDGFGGALNKGDMVRIVSSVMIDEVGVVTEVTDEVPPGGMGQHRITKKVVKFDVPMYTTEATAQVLFLRKALYKLPPDFFTVTNLEAAQRIRKLLLTSEEE